MMKVETSYCVGQKDYFSVDASITIEEQSIAKRDLSAFAQTLSDIEQCIEHGDWKNIVINVPGSEKERR